LRLRGGEAVGCYLGFRGGGGGGGGFLDIIDLLVVMRMWGVISVPKVVSCLQFPGGRSGRWRT